MRQRPTGGSPTDVSVVVAVRDGAQTLRQCMESIFAQQGCTLELIIVDGLSKDATPTIVRSFDDARIVLIREADEGIYDAWNKALTAAKGTWCSFLGADDYFPEPYALAGLVAAAEASPGSPVFVSGRHLLVGDGDARVVGDRIGDLSQSINRGELRSHVGALHRTEALRNVGGFDASFRISGDLDALLRLTATGTLWSTSVLIATVRWGGLSTQPAGSVEHVRERRRILRRYRSPAAAEWLAVLPVIRRAVVHWSGRAVRALLGRGAASRVLSALRRHRAV